MKRLIHAIVLHIMHVTEFNPQAVVVVCCNDTDVLCFQCHHMKRIPVHVYMDTGYDNNNTRKYIDVLKLSFEIGPLCEPLPAICAFSGCDYTAHFM